MDISFPRYLLAKQTVDDRALNRHVYDTLVSCMPPEPIEIIEVGAGVGTMAARLLSRGLLAKANYRVVDSTQENIEFAPNNSAAQRTKAEIVFILFQTEPNSRSSPITIVFSRRAILICFYKF